MTTGNERDRSGCNYHGGARGYRVVGAAAAATVLGLLLAFLVTGSAFAGDIVRVSVKSDGSQASGASDKPTLSAGGLYVCFWSASPLTSDDLNSWNDVYRSPIGGGPILMSKDWQGGSPSAQCYPGHMSGSGAFVIFQSTANDLVQGMTGNGITQVYRCSSPGANTLISHSTAGPLAPSAGGCQATFVGDNGDVLLASAASDLIASDTNGTTDIFLNHAGTITRVPEGMNGAQPNGASPEAAISSDGNYVVFSSQASNLVPGDTNARYDVFRKSLLDGSTIRVSVGPSGVQANGSSTSPRVSADGNFVIFKSDASNLVSGDSNMATDIFVWSAATGICSRVSLNSDGQQTPNTIGCYEPDISGDGQTVMFNTSANNWVPGDNNNKSDVFVRSLATGVTQIVSKTYDDQPANNNVASGVLSWDGKTAAFSSQASNLVIGDNNNKNDVFVTGWSSYIGSFTVLNTFDYAENGYDLGDDAREAGEIVDGEFSSHGWARDGFHVNQEVTAQSYTGAAVASDFLYSGCHGIGVQDHEPEDPWNAGLGLYGLDVVGYTPAQQYLWLREDPAGSGNGICPNENGEAGSSLWRGDDETENSQLEWVWLWACDTLALQDDGTSNWRHAFDQGLNLILGYVEPVLDIQADDAVPAVIDKMFGDDPYEDAWPVWDAFVQGSQERLLYQWAIDGYLNHRYDWLPGENVPQGYINYANDEYYDDSTVVQWNQNNYDDWQDPQPLAASEDAGISLATPLQLAEGRVRVVCDLDETEQSLSVYRPEREVVDLASAAGKVLGGEVHKEAGGQTTAYHTSKYDLVRWDATGMVTLSQKTGGLTEETKLDYETAETKAEDLLAATGGLPSGYRLSNVSTIDVRNIATGGDKKHLAWTFTYTPAVDGIEVMGPAGVGMCVTVSDDGIYFYRRWTPSLVKETVSQKTLSERSAVTRAAASLPLAFGRDTVDIEDVSLVYYSPTVDEWGKSASSALRPAYKVKAKGSRAPVFVDASDGSIIGVTK